MDGFFVAKLHYSERELMRKAKAHEPIMPAEIVAVVERLGRLRLRLDEAGYSAELQEADPYGTFVPLSVRDGGRVKRFGWWLKGRREALALRLAPWLSPRRPTI